MLRQQKKQLPCSIIKHELNALAYSRRHHNAVGTANAIRAVGAVDLIVAVDAMETVGAAMTVGALEAVGYERHLGAVVAAGGFRGGCFGSFGAGGAAAPFGLPGYLYCVTDRHRAEQKMFFVCCYLC